MDIFLTAAILVVIAVAIFTGQAKSPQKKETPKMEDKQQIATPSPAPTPPAPLPQPPAPSNNNMSPWQYPGSTVISSSDNSLTLQSTADTDTITNWYKDKIKASGANAKSFVTTKANDKVLNKLVGSDGKSEIRVEINKDPGSPVVRIDVTISSS